MQSLHGNSSSLVVRAAAQRIVKPAAMPGREYLGNLGTPMLVMGKASGIRNQTHLKLDSGSTIHSFASRAKTR